MFYLGSYLKSNINTRFKTENTDSILDLKHRLMYLSYYRCTKERVL